jgi:hypothetical protein
MKLGRMVILCVAALTAVPAFAQNKSALRDSVRMFLSHQEVAG